MLKGLGIPVGAHGVLGRLFDHRTESAWRHPDSQPAVTEPTGPAHRRVGSASDDDRYRFRRGGKNQRIVKAEELAVEADRRAVGQRAQDLQRLVHATSDGSRVHTTDFELVRILTTNPDAECQPARRQLGDAGELPRHQHGVPQRQQVQRYIARQLRKTGQHRGGIDQRVRPGADMKADVVADAHVVDRRLGDSSRAPRIAVRPGWRTPRQGRTSRLVYRPWPSPACYRLVAVTSRYSAS